jgi:hypothetical protein
MTGSTHSDVGKAFDAVAQSVARARSLFITSSLENLNHCEAELMAAIGSLTNLQHELQSRSNADRQGVSTTAQQIQREVSAFAVLVSQARDFHAGWSGLSEANLAGYTASGAPAPLDRNRSRIAMKG